MIEKDQHDISSQQRSPVFVTAKKQPNILSRNERKTSPRRKYDPIEHNIQMRRNNFDKAQLQRIYEDLMNRSEYTEAEHTKNTIKYLEDREKKRRVRMLSEEHSKQKEAIKIFHKREMQKFREAWKQMFLKQEMKKRKLMQRFSRLREQDQEECKQKITRRCRSAKPTVTLKKLSEVEEEEKVYRKRGKTAELKLLRNEKKKLIVQCRKEQKMIFTRIAQQEQRRMAEKETRRYRSFMHRIEESKKDKEILYRREEHKLKQKYKNMLRNLEHQHSEDYQKLEKFNKKLIFN